MNYILIQWCTLSPDSIGSTPNGFSVTPCDCATIGVGREDVIILEKSASPELNALRRCYKSIAQPVLLRLPEHDVMEALIWLSPKDELCLEHSPTPLVVHRCASC